MEVIQIVILVITMVLWAVIGFIFWIPILVRSTASLTGGILYCTITETDPVYLKAGFQNAVSFYARGFESIRFVFSKKGSAPPESADGDHWDKWFHTLVEMVWATVFWGTIYVAIFGIPGNPLLALRAEYSPEGYYERGQALNSQQKYRPAIEDLTKAIALKPELAGAHFSRGFAYHALKQYQSAIDDYAEYIKLNPSDKTAYWNEGFCHKNLGHTQAAMSDYKKALALETDEGNRAELQQQLKELGQP